MKKDFETSFTGWAFVVASVLLWGGWVLSPHHIGEYIKSSDFSSIGENVWYWIWMYRFHIFGWVTMAIAMFALIPQLAKSELRVVLFSGIGMIVVGTFTIAIGAAFYYNFGAWGVGETTDLSEFELEEFMDGILFTNQYVTCFLRFGRIFSGVGLVLLGLGFIKTKIMSTWLSWMTLLLGAAAMMIILFIPEYYEVYKPIFHLKSLWLLLIGISILRKGLNNAASTELGK